jgi:GntR family transcriptional regulator
MDIIISATSGVPIYQQITEQIKTLIVLRQINEGEMLPSIRQLAKDLRISVITTKRAYEELEREGFIRSIPGKGSFVAPYNTEIILGERLKKIEELLGEVVKESKYINIELEDLIILLRKLYAKA